MSGGKKPFFHDGAQNHSRNHRKIPLASVDIGPRNFKDHFDADIIEYVTEDVRMSTLQRKLVRENNSLVSHALACQISDVIFYLDNRAYVFRSFEVICDAAFEVLHSSKHGDKVKSETANAIGRVGFVLATYNDGDFATFFKYYKKIWDKFREGGSSRSKEKDLIYCLKSMQILLSIKPHISEMVILPLLEDLQITLEKTENHLLVPTLVTSLALISEQHPKIFEPKFQDIVDILVGWHVDIGQSPSLKMHISSVLLSWHSFWIIDLEFSAGLLRQFIEDIESFTEDVQDSSEDLNECVEKIASVVQVFNTVLSCLRSKSARQRTTVSFLPSESLKWSEILLKCLLSTLSQKFDEDILIAGQQSLMMLLERIESLFRDNESEIIAFYKQSVSSLKKLSFKGQSLTLEFSLKMINIVQKQQQVELVSLALENQLVSLGSNTNGVTARRAITKFFRELLKSKNILVLQEAYAALIEPFKASVEALTKHDQQGFMRNEIKTVLFALECLVDLVNAKGSVLSMWALDPPIFILLATHGGCTSEVLAKNHPETHSAILQTLVKHCNAHHQFLASSQLLTLTLSQSPTLENFEKILKTCVQMLDFSKNNLVLHQWIVDVLKTASKSFHELRLCREFDAFLTAALATQRIAIIQTFCQHFTSPSHHRDYAYSVILHHNWNILVPPLCTDWIQELAPKPPPDLELIKLRPGNFKTLCDALITSITKEDFDQEFHLKLVLQTLSTKASTDFYGIQWSGDLIASYCISNKLKTSFGKAQDTLGAYEKTMRLLASNFSKTHEITPSRIRQARNFLIVFDCLEKAMLQAWDGNNLSAFFLANRKTCLDWLSRMRLMTAHLAFYVGEFALALRQCQKALEKATDQQEDLLALAALAMKNLDQSGENISGLYVWASENFNKKFRWMKGLISLAKGRREEGLASIKGHLNNTSGLCQQLLCGELLHGHFSLCEKDSYIQWMEEYYKDSQISFSDDGYVKSLEALCTFATLNSTQDLMPTNRPKNIQEMILSVQHELLRSATSRDMDSAEKNKALIQAISENVALTENQRKHALIIANVQSMLYDNNIELLDTFLTFEERKHSTESLILLKKWGDFFVRFAKKPQVHFQLKSLNLEIGIQARKERNFKLATDRLEQNLECSNLISYISSINFNNLNMFLSTDKANCLRQSAKLAYVLNIENNKMTAVQVLCGIGAIGLRSPENLDLSEIAARSFNTLSKWLRKSPQLMDPDIVSECQESATLTQILNHQPVSTEVNDDLLISEASSDGDMVIGRLLKLATNLAPNLAKIWYEFANWSLEMGEKVLASATNGRIPLTISEESNLRQAATDLMSEEQLQDLIDLVSQIHLKQIELEADKSESMRKTLAELLISTPQKELIMEPILQVWKVIQKRIFYYQEVASRSYFKFISYSESTKKEQKVISATLRLLQLIVKHSFELQESLEEGLDQTPSQCWKAIIPQLFSRLNHPVKVVQNRISDLLCRIANDHPNLVIYPSIVGSMASQTVKVFQDDQKDQEEVMQSAHEKIVHHLSKENPERVEHVKILVSELQRISILWDELWFNSIQQYSNEVNKRVKRMEEEAKKLDNNPNLSAEEKQTLVKDKYYILFKPILYVLNKVESVTKTEPESPMEIWFNDNYGKFIEDMMDKLRDPPDFAQPKKVWSLLSDLQSKIGSKLLRKNQLQLTEISPALANLKHTLIPLPGQELTDLNIDKLEPVLSILPTKTKPKKLKIRANDGRNYTYLFKGLEDLHLDERIMQFLSIANTLMKKSQFSARHYSVVPLGPRSGLIQWVEGAVPMFSFYKKWHGKRQKIAEMTKNTKVLTQKPADQYYNKLIPLLRDHGINNLDNRREWPLSVMRQVLFELMEETPKDLLSSHLYLSTSNAADWNKVTLNLTRSIAVMSVIGYIIGLGDRHLDNLLIDFKKGEIIHIDYNVCFEKGAKLRIPEKVPCRLTQNIINIFGLTGVEGVFRLSCERTLEILRGGKETLLTLLEAFIYDPLVDWTPGLELGLAFKQEPIDDKRDMQAEITFSMLSVRMAEMKSSWISNKSLLSSNLTNIEDTLSGWSEENNGLQILRENLQKYQKAISILKEAESNSSHKLFNLQDRFAEHRAVETAVEASKTKINEFIDEHEKYSTVFQRVMTTLTSGQLTKWQNELGNDLKNWTSECVSDFLKSAGQVHLLEQVEQIETGLRIGLDKLKASLNLGLQLLGHCITMTSMYPSNYKENHRVHLYLKWMKLLNENFNLDTCQLVVNDFNAKFVEKNDEYSRILQHQIMNLNYQLETAAQDIHFRLQNIFKRMISHGIENSKSVIEAGNRIQNEAQDYIKAFPDLCKNLCYAQISNSISRLQDLENLIQIEQFPIQMNGEMVLMDELFSEVAFCGHVLDLMAKLNLNEQNLMIQGFVNVYKQFKNLIGSYFAIILQEGLKNCQNGSMEKATKIIRELDIQNYPNLIQKLNANSANLTSGEMIIVATNSLLDNIDNELVKVGILEEKSKDLAPRLACISEFFNICFRAMNSFKAEVGELFPNGDEMGYPIIKYMANYYLKHFRGKFTQVLQNFLSKENVEKLSEKIRFLTSEARDKGQFLTLEMNAIFANLRKTELALNLEFKVEILNANQQINQLQRNSFQWYHQDSLPLQVVNVQPLRPQVLNDLKNCLSNLTSSQKELQDINSKYQELNSTVEQRLKWACGANPDLQGVFDNFSSAFAAEMESLKSLVGISKALMTSANTIIHHESLRTSSREAVNSDSSVMSLFAECQQSVQLQDAQEFAELGPLEMTIFSMNPPEDLIDKKWIKTTGDLVLDQIRTIDKEIEEEKEKLKISKQNLGSRISDFKKTLTSHQKLMADVGSLLRSIDKAEELEVLDIKNYLVNYREFTDKIAAMLKQVQDDLTEDKVQEIITDIENLKEMMPMIYDNLISLATNLKDESIEQFKKPGHVLENQENQVNVAEEKNAFALSVLRRIKTKLDGREPDVLRKSSVSEQVDFIIREATNVDNLALLYEGWTAWI